MTRPLVKDLRTSALTAMMSNAQRFMLAFWREILAKDCKTCPGVRRPVKWIAKRRARGSGKIKTKLLCDKCVKKLPNDWIVARYG